MLPDNQITQEKMRRRQQQHQQPLMSEPDIQPIDSEEPEVNLDLEEEEDPLIAAFEMSSPHGDERKSLSLLPRNYDTRRRLMVVGGCFILAIVLLQTRSSGKTIMGVAVISCLAFASIVEGWAMAIHSSFLFPHFFGL
jgi:hypothetical protein